MKLISVLASIFAGPLSAVHEELENLEKTQLPLTGGPGYGRAAEALGQSSNDNDIRAAWNAAFAANPARVDAALDPFSGPRGRPLRHRTRNDWDLVIQHKDHPNYRVRAKDPSKLGVDTVKQLSGYLDVLDEDKHFFFWLFESRNDPEHDPVVLWLNGGPGCSSATGLFFELGPASLNQDLTLKHNPHSWNNNATVIFLDEPVNVGFSYSSNRVKDSNTAGEDVYSFLSLLFSALPQYVGNDFHVAGESYGGHYLPAIGKAIISHEERNFNLSSLLIGNGITDPYNQAESQISMACGEGGYQSVLSPEKCAELYNRLPTCQRLLQVCADSGLTLECTGASFYCEQLSAPYYETGRNPYDVRDVCYDKCYPEINWIDDYLNQDHVRDALGAEPIEFVGCSNSVGLDFVSTADGARPFTQDVIDVLEHGVPILTYAGDKDYICNWLGNRKWTERLPWSHHDEYADAQFIPWNIGKKTVGTTRSAGGFTFLRVFDAGHMVPYNKPGPALEMFNHWIGGERTFA